jgi:uncharacterized protein YpiB (UPF0302 family)
LLHQTILLSPRRSKKKPFFIFKRRSIFITDVFAFGTMLNKSEDFYLALFFCITHSLAVGKKERTMLNIIRM